MEQNIPKADEIAKLIKGMNHKYIFSCINEDYFDFTTGVEHKNAAMLTSAFLTKLTVFLESTKSNSIEKKDFIKKVLDPNDKEQVKFLESAKNMYTLRNLYLPVEHAENCLKLIKGFTAPKAKELYKSISEFSTLQIGKDYNTLNDNAKISAEKLYWDSLFENSINDKGLDMLNEEKARYRAALALIPAEFLISYPQFPLHANAFEFLLLVLKAYSENQTIITVGG